MTTRVSFNLNGENVTLEVEARETLADVVRERLGLTATHLGCEHGACGACTVEIDGRTARGCLHLAVAVDGRRINTLEGLGDDVVMRVLKDQFHKGHALQCGFCTPGMLMTARDILKRHRAPNRATITKELSGQLCRCTGYANIVAAIEAAGREIAGVPAV